MRAVWIPKFGKPDVLEVREAADPSPRPDEVRIRVRACGLNFAEIMARQGLYPDAPKPPMVVGYEIAGEIDRCGAEVKGLKDGQRVVAMVRFGGHADMVCAPQRQVFAMPDDMSFEEGAALPVNYLTAYHMLFEVKRVRANERVLIHMAAGGVGTAALQLCKTIGAVTFGTASAAKHEYVRSHGCDHPIDYRSKHYVDEIEAIAGRASLDLVLDPLGGGDWRKGYSLLRPSGMLIAYGWANMNVGGKRSMLRIARELVRLPRYTPIQVMDHNRAVAGVNIGHLWNELPMIRRETEALMKLYQQGSIRPHIDATFPFSQAAEAHHYLERGKNVGKVLLIPE